MKKVRPKKHLGQHFLTDKNIARKITEALSGHGNWKQVLEVGPGMGVLTDFLLEQYPDDLHVIDIDKESIAWLQEHYPVMGDRIIEGDFLKMDIRNQLKPPFALIGNLPYNISSQIFFKVLEYRNEIPEVVGMIQKEVADRIVSPPGNKTYGILSVLLQAWYDIDMVLKVGPGVFNPPPKVNSAVIRLRRNDIQELGCDEKLFVRVIKTGFQNRRKTLRKALKALNLPEAILPDEQLNLRAEQLSVADFILLTNKIQEAWTNSNNPS